MKKMIIMIGIPGAGKTTFADILPTNHVRVSIDRLPTRTRNGEDKLLLKACKSGKDIVVDAANVDKIKRKKYIRFAREYGYSVCALFMDASMDAAMARNESRGRVVPYGAIKGYAELLEVPTLDEGFDRIFTVWDDWDPRRK